MFKFQTYQEFILKLEGQTLLSVLILNTFVWQFVSFSRVQRTAPLQKAVW